MPNLKIPYKERDKRWMGIDGVTTAHIINAEQELEKIKLESCL